MIRPPTRSKRTDNLVPYTTLVRSSRRDAGCRASSTTLTTRLNARTTTTATTRVPWTTGTSPRSAESAASIPNPGMLKIVRSEEHTSELQSLMRISYAVFCLKKKKHHHNKKLYTSNINTHHIS